MADVKQRLEDLGLSQYADTLIAEGFDTWETILDITESDLNALSFKLGHRRKLQRAISETIASSSVPAPARVQPEACIDKRYQSDGSDQEGTTFGTDSAYGSGTMNISKDSFYGSSTTSTKRRYRRHPKPDMNAPERPPSAYVIFSHHIRESLRGQELSFTEIAKIVGERWRTLAHHERERFEQEAIVVKEKYHAELAAYKKTPQYAQYQEYPADFKTNHVTTLELLTPESSNDSSVVSGSLMVPAKSSTGSTTSMSVGVSSSAKVPRSVFPFFADRSSPPLEASIEAEEGKVSALLYQGGSVESKKTQRYEKSFNIEQDDKIDSVVPSVTSAQITYTDKKKSSRPASIGNAYVHCLDLFAGILKYGNTRTGCRYHEQGLRRQYGILRLWVDKDDMMEGKVDRALELCPNLHLSTASLLHKILVLLSQRLIYYMSFLTMPTKDIATLDSTTQNALLRFINAKNAKLPDTSDDSDSDIDDDQDDIVEILDDLETYVQCLVDLGPSIKVAVDTLELAAHSQPAKTEDAAGGLNSKTGIAHSHSFHEAVQLVRNVQKAVRLLREKKASPAKDQGNYDSAENRL